MSESLADRIARLMAQGLEHYGEGRPEQAAACWRSVLELDPGHATAIDYLDSAGLGGAEPDSAGLGAAGLGSADLDAAGPGSAGPGGAEEGAGGGAPAAAAERLSGAADPLAEAAELVRRGEAAQALERVEALAAREPARLEVQAYLELLRAHLLGRYRSRLDEGRAVPRLRLAPERVLELDLPADAGFLLSMVDGTTAVDDLVALAGTDPFAALRTLHGLFEAGVLERAA